ncbi:hypothetical protein K488DRAFT_90057 [Vararia minispora EC-137]|uniref:Uncharacterized protein n=1 Tax=Vararia minispora EC-137 TaxID=1314806 RepID=A0ACB8Q8N1_9AGAM|nr:hypothetical protein K488DRAFT_90057 [Vararia minispora EC-137]
MAQGGKPLMPALARPNPTSASGIHPATYPRHFNLKDGAPVSFPFEPHRENGMVQIHYREFRGQGPPPNDIGDAGDVWMDIRPGHYALYAHKNDQWEKWTGPHKSKKKMFEHPLVPGRYLWCTKKSVLWYTCDGIRKSASLQTRGEEDDFGRERYRTVGPMERGSGRGAPATDAQRIPLRTAEEAIAKILQNEGEDDRRAEVGKRRRPRDDDPPAGRRRRSAEPAPAPAPASASASASASTPTLASTSELASASTSVPPPAPSPLALNTLALPSSRPTPFAAPPPPAPVYPAASSSSLSQALGGLAVSPSLNAARSLPGSACPTGGPGPTPASYPRSSPAQPLNTLFPPPQPLVGTAGNTAYPSPQSQASPLEPGADTPLPPYVRLSAEHVQAALMREEPAHARAVRARLDSENERLSRENERLSRENERLTAEVQRLAAPAALPPGTAELWREFAGSHFAKHFQSLQADVQEHYSARKEAESKLLKMQEQLSKIQEMFRPPSYAADQPLNTPGPSPRLLSSDS